MDPTITESRKSAEILFVYDPHVSPGIKRYQEDLYTSLCKQDYMPTLGYFEDSPFSNQARFSYRLPFPKALGNNRMAVSLWKLLLLEPLLPSHFQLVFFPSQHAPVFRLRNRKLVVTVHDIMPLIYGNKMKKSYYSILLPRLMSCSDTIISCSRHTRDDLLVRFPSVPAEKIQTIPHGTTEADSRPDQGQREKIVLALYRNEPWKNSDLVLSAFKAAALDGYRLINVGQKPKELVVDDRILFVGRVSDQELDRLYRSATCFVYPSLYEGFGFPILEAQARGCPVITSSHGAMKETAGASALLFDANSGDSLKEALQHLVNSRTIQDELRANGFANVKHYNWDLTARRYIKLFNSICDEG